MFEHINLKTISILITLIGAEVAAENLLRNASKNVGSWEYSLILGIIAYIAVAYLFYSFLNHYSGSFGTANIIWQVANILIITAISNFILGDKLNKIQWIGFILLIVGFILTGYNG